MLATPINREYVRTGNWSVTAKACRENSNRWSEISVQDIAAGGLLFLAEETYDIGEVVIIDMLIDPIVPGVPWTIPMKVTGEVRGDRGMRDGMRAYSVRFTEITKDNKIRLDELIRMTNHKYAVDAESDYYR